MEKTYSEQNDFTEKDLEKLENSKSNSTKKLLSMLSMSKAANKLVMGFDSVKNESLYKEVFLLMVTSDVSENTKEEIEFLANKVNISFLQIPFNMDEMKKEIGKKVGVIGITDEGLKEAILKLQQNM